MFPYIRLVGILPLFVFGLFTYWIAQVPIKRSNLIPWIFWGFLVITLSSMETFISQQMIQWYVHASLNVDSPLIMGLFLIPSFLMEVCVFCLLFPLLLSVKRGSTIGDGYLQTFLYKQIIGKVAWFIILVEVVYNVIILAVTSVALLNRELRFGVMTLLSIMRYVTIGMIFYWVNEKISSDAA